MRRRLGGLHSAPRVKVGSSPAPAADAPGSPTSQSTAISGLQLPDAVRQKLQQDDADSSAGAQASVRRASETAAPHSTYQPFEWPELYRPCVLSGEDVSKAFADLTALRAHTEELLPASGALLAPGQGKASSCVVIGPACPLQAHSSVLAISFRFTSLLCTA